MKDKQAKYPQLRFKGFTDPWKQRSFKALYKKVIEKNDLSFESDRIISVANMYYKPNDSKSDEKYMETYNIFRLGDIAFEGHKSKNFAYGRFVENTIGDGIVSHVFDVFRPISEYDLNYWKYFIHYEDIMGQKLRMSTTKATMMNNLVSKDFLKQSVLVPNLDEQQKIGTFFKQLDHLITLHQRKLDLLKEQKKGYLQKMFPKNGAKVPELRFAGFADAWEERKLQEVLRERNNQQPQSMEYPLVSFTVENGVTPKTDRYEREQLVVGDKSSKKYKVTVLNDIVYNPANLKFGAISRNKYGNAVFSPIYITFLVNNDVTTPEFIEMFVTRNDFIKRALKYQQGTVYERQSVSPTDLLAMNVYLPGKSEQEKIGSFFQQLDETITLHQRKLEKLQELKKGYLQKMFC